jgi:uncharacterized protein YgbK (DUF1537 family)
MSRRVGEALLNRVVVLDDDPTGAQTLAGVRVLLRWDADRIAAALAGRPSVHLITNSRALEPAVARERVAHAAGAALAASPDAHLVLRGDSTLRGHLREEYEAVRDGVAATRWPPLLLVPALPSAGRITRDGVHLIRRDGKTTPLHLTEYAADGIFSYETARLIAWAEARSDGLFAAADARELALDELRSRGPAAVTELLRAAAGSEAPSVIAPDAETDADLRLIAEGYAAALRAGIAALVRCAPAFAGILTGTTAAGLVAPPRVGDGRVLLVCGSYVPTTRRQLAALRERHPDAVVETAAGELAGPHAADECARVAAAAGSTLRAERLAVVAVAGAPRGSPDLELASRVAAGLAEITRQIEPLPQVVIAKGGVTSAVTLRDGLGASEAEVVGPMLPGVSYWRAESRDHGVDYVVVPGNVGGDDLLVRLLETMIARC